MGRMRIEQSFRDFILPGVQETMVLWLPLIWRAPAPRPLLSPPPLVSLPPPQVPEKLGAGKILTFLRKGGAGTGLSSIPDDGLRKKIVSFAKMIFPFCPPFAHPFSGSFSVDPPDRIPRRSKRSNWDI